MSGGDIRVEYVGDRTGSVTLRRVNGTDLSRPYTLGKNTLHRYANATPADAKLLIEAGFVRAVQTAGQVDAQQMAPRTAVTAPTVDPQQVTAREAVPAAPPPPPPSPSAIAEMNIPDLRAAVVGLTADELRAVLAAETAGKGRKQVVGLLSGMIADTERVG